MSILLLAVVFFLGKIKEIPFLLTHEAEQLVLFEREAYL